MPLSLTISWVKTALVVIGVLFLSYIGWVTWHGDVNANEKWNDASGWPPRRQILFTLSVSLLNPHAILDTIGVIGTSALLYEGDASVAFTLACILNSWLWFFMLMVVGRLVGTFGTIRKALSRVSAVIMWVSAIYLGYNLGRY